MLQEHVTAKLFKNGNSQAVRLPKEFRFEGDEVLLEKRGDQVIISPKPKCGSWREFFESEARPTEDFMSERDMSLPQERELF